MRVTIDITDTRLLNGIAAARRAYNTTAETPDADNPAYLQRVVLAACESYARQHVDDPQTLPDALTALRAEREARKQAEDALEAST